jgi:pimeloyl-[acyl-carrier protein] methyl ester esterase
MSYLFIHGWGMTAAVWQPLLTCLPPQTLSRCVTLPGHDGQPVGSPTLVAWRNVLLENCPNEPVVMVGWSLGGMLALDFALHYPNRVAKLILLGSNFKFVRGADWPHGLDSATVTAFADGFAQQPAATLKRFLALQVLGEANPRQLTRQLNQYLAPISPGLADGLQLLAQIDLRAAAQRLSCPLRILHGRDDALMPVSAAQAMTEPLEQARLTILDRTGHALLLSQPQRCADLIEAFVNDPCDGL